MQRGTSFGKPLIAAAAAAGCVAAVALPTSSAARSASAAATPACSSTGTVAWLNTTGNGAAGSVSYKLQFTNLTGARCTLRGFPGVSAVNTRGKQLGSAATRDTTTPKRTITLNSGATARAVLRIVQAGNFPSSSCRPVTAAGLRVFPPNQKGAQYIPFPFSACSRSGPKYLSVQVVTR